MVTAVVIDDDLDTVEVLCEFLEIKNISVIGKGYDGKDAARLYQKLNPDVMFLDIAMPRYNGLYALKKIQKLNPNVIVVTADLTADTEEQLKKFNVPVIIYKPFDFIEIIKAVEHITKKPVIGKPMVKMA